MKKIFMIAALMFIASAARAQTQVYTSVSSATWCYITISTSVPTRVDNFNGLCESTMTGRTSLRILNGSGTLHGGYDRNVSTLTTSVKYGEVFSPNDFREMSLSSAMQYWMMSEPADPAPKIIVQQARTNTSR